ncbi:MAG: hypothetical protein IH991_23830, partial [Planctomycetes bacterium]|nr:hypothetical protein [Planctomycetota bacterium]
MKKDTLRQFLPFVAFVAGMMAIYLIIPAGKSPTFDNEKIVKLADPSLGSDVSITETSPRRMASLSAVSQLAVLRASAHERPTRTDHPSLESVFDVAPRMSTAAPPVAAGISMSGARAPVPVRSTRPASAINRRTAPAKTVPAAREWALVGKVTTTPDELHGGWPYPERLKTQLDALAADFDSQQWATEIWAHFNQLQQMNTLSAPECVGIFQRLEELARQSDALAKQSVTQQHANYMWRAKSALERRLATWRLIHEIATTARQEQAATQIPGLELHRRIAKIEDHLRDVSEPDLWRKYLILGVAQRILDDEAAPDSVKRELAWRMLQRLESPALSAAQKAFFDQPAFRDLNTELRRWANIPIEYSQL